MIKQAKKLHSTNVPAGLKEKKVIRRISVVVMRVDTIAIRTAG